jgi:hypothetical protein
MELEVGAAPLVVVAGVSGGVEGGEGGFELLGIRVGRVGDGELGGEGFEGEADAVDVDDLLAGEAGDRAAFVGVAGEEAFVLKHSESFAGGGLADAELAGDAPLDDAVAGAQVAVEDGLAEAVGDLCGDGLGGLEMSGDGGEEVCLHGYS